MHAWYVKRGEKLIGPFPAGQISQSLLLGRLVLKDEISHDKKKWLTIGDVPDLIPDVLKMDANDPQVRERLQAAKRWADERRNEDRRVDEEREESSDRRQDEAMQLREYRSHRESSLSQSRHRQVISSLVLILLLIVLGSIFYNSLSDSPEPLLVKANCEAAPAPGVNWSHCRMSGLHMIKRDLHGAVMDSSFLTGANLFGSNLSGVSLAYADLSLARLGFTDMRNAKLKGANLQGADLSNAELTGADLSYADLQGANLENTNLQQVKLANTIWTDGRVCLPDSVGECRSPNKQALR